jgi:cation transport ATPase
MILSAGQRLSFRAFQVTPAGELYEQDFLSLAASISALWDHPMGGAILDIARKNSLPLKPVIGFKDFPGEGVGGAVEVGPGVYRAVVLGDLAFLKLCGLQIPELLEVARRRWEEEPGAILAFAGWDGWIRGILKFS